MQAKQEDFRDYRTVHKPPKVLRRRSSPAGRFFSHWSLTRLSTGPGEVSAGDQLQHSADQTEAQQQTRLHAVRGTHGVRMCAAASRPSHAGCGAPRLRLFLCFRTSTLPGTLWRERRKATRSGSWARSGVWRDWSIWLRSSTRRLRSTNPGPAVRSLPAAVSAE